MNDYKNLFLFGFVLIFSMLIYTPSVCGEDRTTRNNRIPARNVHRSRRRPVLSSGAFIERKTDSKKICIVNAQNRLTDIQLSAIVQEIDPIFHFPVEIVKGKGSNPQILAEKLYEERTDVAAIIIFIQTADTPAVLLAPEEPWGSINVGKLYSPTQQGNLLVRTRKEFWRTFFYLLGSGNSIYPHCVLKTVSGIDDLDALKTQVACPESFNKVLEHTTKLGIKPRQIVPYATAIKEGWAPSPTNDIQRAIWKQVRDMRPETLKQ